ncbi:hypothetical protein VFPPC_12378 [Pochonia chlamydosporia 170]|uniref:MADS-box domain-containing protein n=1 Tax=Pochonia chlamydosporia 170 TaxID=1380566 RepID=A0A179EX41_METCM|nr:hypothetical protein VFPPC_12378 [Pochonia chlamydosporia 170]OAQ57754.1 hypothetical protein VFPPC_12378 [Pochonia chlamydosporia 170]
MKTPPEKRWKQRKSGIMKKVQNMHWDFGAKAALYLERNGELFVYRSHEDFAWKDATFFATQILTPEDFITVAQERNSRQSQRSTPSTAGHDASSTADQDTPSASEQEASFTAEQYKPVGRETPSPQKPDPTSGILGRLGRYF